MVLSYLCKFKHFSCSKFFLIRKYAKVIQIQIQKSTTIVNSLNSYNNSFRKQKMVLSYLCKFKHFLCSKFFLIRKYAKVIQIQKLIKFIAQIENDFARAPKCIFSSGWWLQPELKIWPARAKTKRLPNIFSSGWCLQPELKIYF